MLIAGIAVQAPVLEGRWQEHQPPSPPSQLDPPWTPRADSNEGPSAWDDESIESPWMGTRSPKRPRSAPDSGIFPHLPVSDFNTSITCETKLFFSDRSLHSNFRVLAIGHHCEQIIAVFPRNQVPCNSSLLVSSEGLNIAQVVVCDKSGNHRYRRSPNPNVIVN